eukprot:1189895-Prorocentrum_minimum.AAC.2
MSVVESTVKTLLSRPITADFNSHQLFTDGKCPCRALLASSHAASGCGHKEEVSPTSCSPSIGIYPVAGPVAAPQKEYTCESEEELTRSSTRRHPLSECDWLLGLAGASCLSAIGAGVLPGVGHGLPLGPAGAAPAESAEAAPLAHAGHLSRGDSGTAGTHTRIHTNTNTHEYTPTHMITPTNIRTLLRTHMSTHT